MNKGSKKILIAIVAAIVLMLFVGIFVFIKNSSNPATMDNQILVTTSFYPLYFLASEIGGDLVRVENLTPAGTEPHDYELTAQDIIKIKKSKILFLNGGGLETWSADIKNIIKSDKPTVVTLGEGLINEKSTDSLEYAKDPHIWLSPVLAVKMAEKIAEELIKIDSENKKYYVSNLSILKTKLVNLDNTYKIGLKNCQRREFITSHSAFGYLAQSYDLKQVSISGLSPEEEPSVRQLFQIAKFAKEKEIKYIFFESLVSPRLAETIAREVGAQTLVLNPIEGLSGEELAQGKNYLTEMEKNLENLKIAMECN